MPAARLTSAASAGTLRAALAEAIGRLESTRVPSARLAAELLLMHSVSHDRAWLYAHLEDAFSPDAAARYLALVDRRAQGVPTQYLTCKQEFWGLEFTVRPGVLIPRPETEHVVEVALERLGARRSGLLRVADVGTGSGCIAVALASELPGAEVFATDISPEALQIARENAARHGFSARIHFEAGNLLDAFQEQPAQFDLIASNPPYVAAGAAADLQREIRDHEPSAALFGGKSGAEIYAPLIAQAGHLLVSGGFLVLELGHDSLPLVHPLLESGAWRDLRVTNDLAGFPRVISAARA